ncbi:hypothetical protein SAMN05444362_12170 [Dysgonomonas macrotermitis]|uniref:Uncharacterized protein n=1 Tax=Dysgonomonas macrotermitis TaxID=1346286 RepID=A0A1M5IZU7_9BACT|nr:hypothetical protein SAMN05444362_12170 [Dysgonomonas macrotermitis]
MNIEKEERKMRRLNLAVKIYTIITGTIIAGLICSLIDNL